VSPGEIRITWEFPAAVPGQQFITTHLKIECSETANFTRIISSKLVSINSNETLIYGLNIQQPYYARVATVRNFNGERLTQDVYTVSSQFCAGQLSYY